MGKDTQTDANTAPASSTGAESDVKSGVATSTGSSSVGTSSGDNEPSSIDQIVDNAMAASKTAADEGQEGSVLKSNQTAEGETPVGEIEKAGEEGEEAPEPQPGAEKQGEKEGEQQPPFHEHPRWKEMVTERNELREFKKAYEPMVQRYQQVEQFRESYGINDEQYNAALEIAALLNTDPVRALEKLRPVMEALGQYDEKALPADLATDVENGDLTEERAQELAKLRAQTKAGEVRQKMTQQQREQQRVIGIQQSLTDWDRATMKADPDFRPKAKQEDPDGKYEMVMDKLRAQWAVRPVSSPQEATAQAQQAYESVQKMFSRFIPAKPAIKHLHSQSASVPAKKDPETAMDVANEIASKWGIT